jgi:CHAT domain-containing protein/tetratricopeptide (TPR) repeat protein
MRHQPVPFKFRLHCAAPLTLAILLGIPCIAQTPAQQPAPAAQAAAPKSEDNSTEEPYIEPDTVDEAQAALKKAEARHPGNTQQVADALIDLVELELMSVPASDEMLELAKHTMAVAEGAEGKESGLYVHAMSVEAWVYLKMDRPDLGRPIAEEAMAIAQRNGGGHPLADAASALGNSCAAMGDNACYLQNSELAAKIVRQVKDLPPLDLVSHLHDLVESRGRAGDMAGAAAVMDEILAIAAAEEQKQNVKGQRWATTESNAGAFYINLRKYDLAIPHLQKAIDLDTAAYGPDNDAIYTAVSSLAYAEACANQVADAVKNYERARVIYLRMFGPNHTNTASLQEGYASLLNFNGRYQDAADMALSAHRTEREHIRLAIRLLPERQALTLANEGAISFNVAMSLATLHPEIRVVDVYQEVVRSRALVAEEMAQREAALSRKHDPAVAALENEMEADRKAVMELQSGAGDAQGLSDATAKMEHTERELAARSAAFRIGERARSSDLADLRRNLPARSVLISYVRYTQYQMRKEKFGAKWVQSYAAFVLHPGSDAVGVHDLGEAKAIDDLVSKMRASADAEAHGGGLGSARNEREYREAGEKLRELVWDPMAGDLKDEKMALIVPDGVLNLVPFSALPQGEGYLVEHGPVVHILTSERDLIPAASTRRKAGLVAVGSPAFELARVDAPPATLRDAPVDCEAFGKIEFNPLPASLSEVKEISTTWKRWNRGEPDELLTGENATRTRFLDAATHSRVLHVATHAFVLDQSCGNGNPLLHSGLVFAGANINRNASILTAQQIASLDLAGVDWAVLSACNTGNGELKDGEGVLGLERSFRVAGAKSVVMTLWPVDDEVTREFMRGLYEERFGQRATTANATWNAARGLLKQRREAGKSTHPWYWAGFVGAGEWQ